MTLVRSQAQTGFTIIEMIVSLAVFAVVITISIGALLILISTNQKLQAEQSVLTNLAFALDSMTREIRTGTRYLCASLNNYNTPFTSPPVKIFENGEDLAGLDLTTEDCPDGNSSNRRLHGITFFEGGQSVTNAPETRIVYFFDEDDNTIYRRISGGERQPIVSSGIFIEDAQFYVTGSEAWDGGIGEVLQPTVTIFIKAREKDDPSAKAYAIQTTVTQRTLDI